MCGSALLMMVMQAKHTSGLVQTQLAARQPLVLFPEGRINYEGTYSKLQPFRVRLLDTRPLHTALFTERASRSFTSVLFFCVCVAAPCFGVT